MCCSSAFRRQKVSLVKNVQRVQLWKLLEWKLRNVFNLSEHFELTKLSFLTINPAKARLLWLALASRQAVSVAFVPLALACNVFQHFVLSADKWSREAGLSVQCSAERVWAVPGNDRINVINEIDCFKKWFYSRDECSQSRGHAPFTESRRNYIRNLLMSPSYRSEAAINGSTDWLINLSKDRWIDWSTNQKIDGSTNRKIHHSKDRAIKWSTDW